jgi:predicted dehydrogenase
MKKVCLIGGGNITNLRHVPALKKHANRVQVIGAIGADPKAVQATATSVGAPRTHIVDPALDPAEQLAGIPWLDEVDLAVIGTPPQTHAQLGAAAIERGLNVLIEKPFTLRPEEAIANKELADRSGKVMAVMHNFQYTNGAQRMLDACTSGELGEIQSFFMLQFTSRNRRLPVWYNSLPLGLFFDEAAHFFYLLRRLGGPLDVLNADAQFLPDPADRTPILMNAMMTAGGIPAQMSINFNAPVCEWMFVVSGSKKLACYDFFRDILSIVPSDNTHLAGDILRTSMVSTFNHWKGFITNGVRLVTGNLHYGVDKVVGHVLDALDGAPLPEEISAARGVETIQAMNRIVELSERDRKPG